MTTRISRVTQAMAAAVSFPGAHRIFVAAHGVVPTSGWSDGRLSPYFYITPPADGIWDFNFIADGPSGIVLQMECPISATASMAMPNWVQGVRIHAATNKLEAKLATSMTTDRVIPQVVASFMAGRAHVEHQIAVYDDSFQPIGLCGGFHVRMKKLRHELTLVIEGPDEQTIRSCIEQAIGLGLAAAIVAVFITGGAALQAAITALLTHLKNCLGDAFSARLENKSHWIEWCT